MNCQFCTTPVEFSQEKMAHRIFELDDTDNNGWLCRDCADIREEGHKTTGVTGERDTCIDCDEEVTYGVTLVKKTPRGNVESDGTVFQVLCDEHFDERSSL